MSTTMRIISPDLRKMNTLHTQKCIMKLLPDDGLILDHLKDNFPATKDIISSLPPEKLVYRFEKGEWTIKEIFVHIIDDERIFLTAPCRSPEMKKGQCRVSIRTITLFGSGQMKEI